MRALPASVYELLLLTALDGTGDLRLIRAIAAERGGEGLGPAERDGLVRAAELSPSGKGRGERLAEAAYLGSIVTGDLRDAPRLLEQARRAHPGPGGPLSTAVAGAYHLLHGEGDVDTAHRLLITAISEQDDPRDAHNKVLIEALYTLIMICFFGGRAELWLPGQDIIDRLKPRPPELLAILAKTFSDPARLTPAMLARADASVTGLGQQVSPARITRTGIAVAYRDRLSPRLRLVVLASAAITEPRADAAALEQAITEPGNDRWPFDLARIQLTYGSHLRRRKRNTDARRQLASAAEAFQRLGATPWEARANRELRATGVTVAKADTGLASLTPQQRQIALLAAAGHTNKEIAARLFLSPRTVSTHLYQVFPKLGITSRAALRDALADTPFE